MKKMIRYVCMTLAAVLLCPIMTVSSQEVRRTVHVGGMPFGLTMYTNGVVVVNVDDSYDSPAVAAGLRENDIITRANDEEITSNERLHEIIASSKGADIELSVLRGKSPLSMTLTPKTDDDGNYTAGMWIRDSTAGLGTITYFDENTHSFGALGHGICDRDTGLLMPLGSGKIVTAQIGSITKAKKGIAGGLNGYMSDDEIGEMTVNNSFGVYGSEEYPCAFNNEIETGPAQIITTLDDGGLQTFDVEIEGINLNNKSGQNMVVRVTDEELLDKTGGIVQGMSGSPIIQNDRLIGAVTHVFVNSPEKGYGITIGNMLSCYEQFGGIREES